MDLSEYWQENKRFVLAVASGLVVFLIGLYAVDAVYGADLSAARAAEARHRRDLRDAMYTRSAQDAAEAEHEALRAAYEELAASVGFEPREDFVLRPGGSSPSGQFHQIVGRVREELLPAAARANLRLDKTLGLPELSPTQEGEIVRHLEALDVIERVARSAMEHRVERLEDLKIELDPTLASRSGSDRVETTKVEMTVRGDSLSLMRVFGDLQRGDAGPVVVHRFEMMPARNNPDEARLDLILAVVRIHAPPAEEV